MDSSRNDSGTASGRPLAAPLGPKLGLPRPIYEGRSLVNVPSSIARAVGAKIAGEPPLAPPLDSDLDPFAGRRAEGPVVVLLVDGLGWRDPDRTAERARAGFPAAWAARARPITSVFPTTTTVVLTSLTSAEPPSRHGVVGHRMYLPAYGHVAEILRMSPRGVPDPDTLAGPEWSPSMVSGMPTIFRRGLPGVALTRSKFQPTAFTRMLYDGAEFVGFATGADFAYRLGELLRRPEPGPVIFAYWDDLDTVQHVHGPRAEFDAFEAGQLGRVLASARDRLAPDLARRTTVIITGDHGQVPITPSAEIAIDQHPEVVALLARPPTGDRRAAFLTARSGRRAALEDALAAILPAGHRVVGMADALDDGLFGPGPYHPEIAERLGDLLVLVPPPASITYRLPGGMARDRFLAGGHGGLDPAELWVPLISGPLTEL